VSLDANSYGEVNNGGWGSSLSDGTLYESLWADGVLVTVRCTASVPLGEAMRRELPLFRIKEHRLGLATVVSVPAQRHAMHADRRRCTQMCETRNETARLCIRRSSNRIWSAELLTSVWRDFDCITCRTL
jgi:hypothetical protein